MIFPYEEFDLSGVKTYPLKSRASKARAEDFGRPHEAGASLGSFVDALPNILAGADFKAVVRAIVDAKRCGGGVVWGLGAHVIKTGLGPVLVDLMDRGFVSAIAANGAAVIHDFEVALVGATSEDVDEALGPGRFGMADETGRLLNGARLEHGVYLNCGSAVVLPEVFLKAVALARNRGIALADLTTVNLDFLRMYRPHVNVVTRPTAASGRGYSLIGHHEIMIPLLAASRIQADQRL